MICCHYGYVILFSLMVILKMNLLHHLFSDGGVVSGHSSGTNISGQIVKLAPAAGIAPNVLSPADASQKPNNAVSFTVLVILGVD